MSTPTQENVQRYLRPEELAERWGTTTGTLANWRVHGTGPAYVKIGTMVRYSLAAIEAYEAAQTVETVQPDRPRERPADPRLIVGPVRPQGLLAR